MELRKAQCDAIVSIYSSCKLDLSIVVGLKLLLISLLETKRQTEMDVREQAMMKKFT